MAEFGFINSSICANFRDAPDPVLVFVHAQRTGGSAFRGAVLENVYGRDKTYAPRNVREYKHWPQLTDVDLAGFKIYAGHSNYRELRLSRPFFFITLLRDPVLRAISLYHYCQRKEGNSLRELANRVSLEEFHILGAQDKPAYFVNVQCRRICGKADAELAVSTLQRRFVGAGITEEIPTFVEKIAPELSWGGASMPQTENLASRHRRDVPSEFARHVRERDAEDEVLMKRVLDWPA